MFKIYQICIHVHISQFLIYMHALAAQQNDFASVRQQFLNASPKSLYIHHNDHVVLYNVHHQSGIIASTKYDNIDKNFTSFNLVVSGNKLDETNFLSAVASNDNTHQESTFTIFQIKRKDHESGKIQTGDRIQLKLIHAPMRWTSSSKESEQFTKSIECSFCPDPSDAKIFVGNFIQTGDRYLQHGIESHFETTRNKSFYSYDHNNGWKIFVAGSTLDTLTYICKSKDIIYQMQAIRKNDSIQHNKQLQNLNQTMFSKIARTRRQNMKKLRKLNRTIISLNDTIHVNNQAFNQNISLLQNDLIIAQETIHNIRNHTIQLNETLLKSESYYQFDLQTKQTEIANLNERTRNLQMALIGAFLVFGLLCGLLCATVSCMFLISCCRNSKKENKQSIDCKTPSPKLHGLYRDDKQIHHRTNVGLSGAGETSIYHNCNNNENANIVFNDKNCENRVNQKPVQIETLDNGEQDVDLDIIEGMINNEVKPSFMVRTKGYAD